MTKQEFEDSLPPVRDIDESERQEAASADTIHLDTEGLQAARDATGKDSWQSFEDDLPTPPRPSPDPGHGVLAYPPAKRSRLVKVLWAAITVGVVAVTALTIAVSGMSSSGDTPIAPSVASAAGATTDERETAEGPVHLEMAPDPVGNDAEAAKPEAAASSTVEQDVCSEPPDQETWFRCMNAGYSALRAEVKDLRAEVTALRGRDASIPSYIEVFAVSGFAAFATMAILALIRLFKKNDAEEDPARPGGDIEDLS